MNPHPLHIVVLAAGEGTRMRSATPKVLHTICGRSLLGHVLAAADSLHPAQVVVVLASDTISQVRAAFTTPHYQFVVQAERLGTGHAVLQARPLLAEDGGTVLVLFGDTPLLRSATAATLLEALHSSGAVAGLVSFCPAEPTGYGRVLRDSTGHVIDLVEERNASAEQRAIREVNSGIMAFDAAWLWQHIGQVARNPVKGEYYLTDLVALAVASRGPGAVVAHQAADETEAWGINDRAQLAAAEAALRTRINADLLRSGVTLIDPAQTYVDVTVSVGRDTTLHPGTVLRGATSVGAGCEIGPYTTIEHATIGERARLRYALVEGVSVPAGAEVGPFVYLR